MVIAVAVILLGEAVAVREKIGEGPPAAFRTSTSFTTSSRSFVVQQEERSWGAASRERSRSSHGDWRDDYQYNYYGSYPEYHHQNSYEESHPEKADE